MNNNFYLFKVINQQEHDSNEMNLRRGYDYDGNFDSMRSFLRERRSQRLFHKILDSYVPANNLMKRNPIWMKSRKPHFQ
jgi:hypothetical protein